MKRAKERAVSKITAVDAKVKRNDVAMENDAMRIYDDSFSMRARAEDTLVNRGTIEPMVSDTKRALRETEDECKHAVRRLNAALVNLGTAIAPALDVKEQIDAATKEDLLHLTDAVEVIEWKAADRAVMAWERFVDAASRVEDLLRPRVRARVVLEEKIKRLEEGRFVTIEEDEEMRDRGRKDVVNRVRLKLRGGGDGGGGDSPSSVDGDGDVLDEEDVPSPPTSTPPLRA